MWEAIATGICPDHTRNIVAVKTLKCKKSLVQHVKSLVQFITFCLVFILYFFVLMVSNVCFSNSNGMNIELWYNMAWNL